jgi:hypothetical protein
LPAIASCKSSGHKQSDLAAWPWAASEKHEREASAAKHVLFIVRDLDRTAALFCQALGAVEVYDSKDCQLSLSREKFFLLGGV